MRGYYLDDDAVTRDRRARRGTASRRVARGGRERMTAVAIPAGPLLADVLERAADPEVWERFERQLRSTGYCRRPIRLRGQVDAIDKATGEVVTVYSTEREPDETLLKCCGNRREAVCPSCANTYRGDAYQLVAAGMRGGKGVPESVAEQPLVFLTLTAPSFGPVHSRRVDDGEGAALPAAPGRRDVPARRLARVREGPRRGRPVPRRADLRALLRLRARGAVERDGARAVAPHARSSSPRELARLARASRSASCRCWSPTSRSPSSSAAARCTSTASCASTASARTASSRRRRPSTTRSC